MRIATSGLKAIGLRNMLNIVMMSDRVSKNVCGKFTPGQRFILSCGWAQMCILQLRDYSFAKFIPAIRQELHAVGTDCD